MNLTKRELQTIRGLLATQYDKVKGDSFQTHYIESIWSTINNAIAQGDYLSEGTKTSSRSKKIPVKKEDMNDLF